MLRNIFIYDFDIQEGKFLRRSNRKFVETVKLLRFKYYTIHTNHIDNFIKCFRCPSCDTFFKRSEFLNKHILSCKDRMRHIYPKNVYELQKTLFEKLERFNFPVFEDNKLFKNLAIFDFESISVPTEGLKETQIKPGSCS